MENPQNYIQLDNKNMLKLSNKQVELVLSQHADIIDKLFNMNALEVRDGKIKVTSKGNRY